MSLTIEAKEQELIRKFRTRVTDVVPAEKLYNDHYLIRWLRARDMDLEKAESMLRKSLSWVRRNEMESVMTWKPIQNYYRYAVLGHDDEGCPIFILPIGLWDLREAVDAGDIVPAFRCVLRVLERMEVEIKLSAKRLDRPVAQVVLVFDFQQFSYRQLNSRTVCQGAIEFFRIFEANYPEILKSCMFINTPRIFPIFFALLKPFISGNTMKKMEFFGPQKKKWIASLEKKVPMDIVPPHYGGTREGVDEFCSESNIWNDDEPLPKNFYGTEAGGTARRGSYNDFGLGNMDAWITEEIGAGSRLELEFPITAESVKDASQLLKWQIKSDGYDIGFKVTFRPEGSKADAKEAVDYRRIDSHVTPHEGSLVCGKPGIYTVILDNSYSKRRKKTVLHHVYLVEMESCSSSSTLQVPVFHNN